MYSYVRPRASPSSIVSGRLFPKVSGKRRATVPAKTEEHPKIKSGNGCQYFFSTSIRGATIPPKRPDMEHSPTPAVL